MDRNQRAALAEQIRDRRKNAGLTQAELAEKSGVSLRALQDIERLKVLPQEATLMGVLTALDMAPTTTAAEGRSTIDEALPSDVRTFLMVMREYLLALPEGKRVEVMGRFTRQIFE